jgi:hypothetical protein
LRRAARSEGAPREGIYLPEVAGGGDEGGEADELAAEPDGFSTVTVVWSFGGWAAPPQADAALTRLTTSGKNLQYVSITAEHTRCRATGGAVNLRTPSRTASASVLLRPL